MEEGLYVQIEELHRVVRQAGEEVVFGTFPKKTLYYHSFCSPWALLIEPSSELQQLVLSTASTDSPFHDDNLVSIGTTVYPSPSDLAQSDTPSKKRKSLADAPNSNKSTVPRIAQQDTRIAARWSNIVLENKHIKRLHAIIKKECGELIASIDKVRLWVTLAIPKLEDGDTVGSLDVLSAPTILTNSEGVRVQEEILNELQRAQDCAYNLRDSARQHHLARAKLCSKLIKYPCVEDYTSALLEHDEKQIFNARHSLLDMRDLYAALTDITQKNIAKIRVPR